MELGPLSVGLLFGGSVTLIVLYWGQVTAPRRVARARVAPSRGSSAGLAPALRSETGRLPFVERLPLSTTARARMDVELDRAGVPLRVSEYLGLRVSCALGAGLVAGLVMTGWGAGGAASVFVGLLLAVLGWGLPAWWVESKRKQRVRKVETQLPEALTIIAKSLRAGSGLVQAIAFAAGETPAPLGSELARALRDLRLGADAEGVFAQLSERVSSQDLDIAVTAIIIQRSVGGNLGEILTNVANTIRQRERLRREVLVLTSRQRLTSWLMAGMPVLIAGAFILLNPEAGKLLFETSAGRIALAVGIGFEVLGLLLIRRLAVIEI